MRPFSHETSIRRPAVAGLFYPSDPAELRDAVSEHLRHAPAAASPPPKALIVPHAGYVYSGDVAAVAYAQVASLRDRVRRVVLIGPSHRVYLRGGAVPHADVFETPLGRVPVDSPLRKTLLERGDVMQSDQPHAMEHCLEVQLPFLQTLFEEFTLLPVVLGEASPDYVASILADVWGDDDTLVLASSDLSHYHPYDAARRIDAITSASILRYEAALSGDQACGAMAVERSASNRTEQASFDHGACPLQFGRHGRRP